MVSLITPSNVCKRFKIQLLILLLVTSVYLTCITPVLKSLHWLPVNYRINFKICCITHHIRCLYMNLIILVLCSAFDQILIPFVLPLSARYIITILQWFLSFSYAAHVISGIFYLIPNNIHTTLTYKSFKKIENLSF